VSQPPRLAFAPLAALSLLTLAALPAPLSASLDLGHAQGVFQEVKVICERDGGRLWGRSLCGPVLLVDPDSRAVIANQADQDGALVAAGPVFTGHLPASVDISNTPTEWSGTHWTELIWPTISADESVRRVSLAHESFHRIQPDLGFFPRREGDNGHLDTLEGRYLLQLEWRALAKAMGAASPNERRRAVDDALTFRAERYRLFPNAAAGEATLELLEGVAEYTGVKLGLTTPEARVDYAIRDLTVHVDDPSYVRSFAYATGPAYGLLLDRFDPEWRSKLRPDTRLDLLLRTAMKFDLPQDLENAAKARAAQYDSDGALRAAEVKREAVRQQRLAGFKAKFVEGPVLRAALHHMNVQFNPTTLQAFAPYGTVYPTLRITADFGVLEVSDGALLDNDWKTVTVSAAHVAPDGLKGDGWTLTLKPGWTVVAGARAGDLEVTAKPGA
jgi:hypothetical protein